MDVASVMPKGLSRLNTHKKCGFPVFGETKKSDTPVNCPLVRSNPRSRVRVRVKVKVRVKVRVRAWKFLVENQSWYLHGRRCRGLLVSSGRMWPLVSLVARAVLAVA
jgi:hypothetical protein